MTDIDDDLMLEELRTDLHYQLMTFARRPSRDPEVFDTLAARVLAYQARAVPSYGRLVAALGADLDSWQTAPLVPTELFRALDLCSLPPSPGDRVFRTSGTTGKHTRGSRRVPDLSLYRTAMAAPFIEHVLAGDASPKRWISLIPSEQAVPDSSLSFMVNELAGVLASQCFWIFEREGLNLEEARIALGEGLGVGDQPVLVLATPLALIELLERARWFPRLPAGSRVMLTGGFKAAKTSVPEDELYEKLASVFGVPRDMVVAEYGMTELTSQAYGTPLTPNPALRLRIVHPESGADLPPGEVGLVACFDLLNLDHVSALLTSDLGVLDEAGRLTLRGRMPGAAPRGCSLTAEEILAGEGV